VEGIVGLEFLAGIETAQKGIPTASRIAEEEAVVLELRPGSQAEEAMLECSSRADAVFCGSNGRFDDSSSLSTERMG
jgi:hypothetical protein